MRSRDLWQVVVNPDDGEEARDAATEEVAANPPTPSTWSVIKLYLADYLHPLGIHHWVQYRTFDMPTRRIIVWPHYWICSQCPKGRIG